MDDPPVSIIMRSFNEAWALKETLPALAAQEFSNWELIVIDSGSSDGSQDLIRAAAPAHFIQIEPHEYNPSRVMNRGMEIARPESQFGIFLNADATPQGSGWLRPLVEGLRPKEAAAVFGRQIPRPDCHAVFAHDYERCFGAQRESASWDHFFSMVSSGIRRDVWAKRGFRDDLQYAEDDEYTRWCIAQGYEVRYVPESVVMHSHNYTAEQAFRRAFGDARAMAATYAGKPEDFSWRRTVAVGFLSDWVKDLRWCKRNGRLGESLEAAKVRWMQRRGRLAGFRQGWDDYQRDEP